MYHVYQKKCPSGKTTFKLPKCKSWVCFEKLRIFARTWALRLKIVEEMTEKIKPQASCQPPWTWHSRPRPFWTPYTLYTYFYLTDVIIRYNFPWAPFLFFTRKIQPLAHHTKAMSSGKNPKFVDQNSSTFCTIIMYDEHIPGNVASAATPNYPGVRIWGVCMVMVEPLLFSQI